MCQGYKEANVMKKKGSVLGKREHRARGGGGYTLLSSVCCDEFEFLLYMRMLLQDKKKKNQQLRHIFPEPGLNTGAP